MGRYYIGESVDTLTGELATELRGGVQLIITSPPFPLNEKKSYGNLSGEEYLSWFTALAPIYADLLTPDGSVVLEVGNAWEAGRPVQSLLHLQSLMAFVSHPNAHLRLCQQFVCYNPARMPSPAPWVTRERIRFTDSYTHVWWMAKTDRPKADNRRVLRPYSKSMKDLLARGEYNSGKRPSQHDVSENGFLRDQAGSISPNFIELEGLDPEREVRLPNAFSFANTGSNDYFHRRCRELGITPHPARMPAGLAAFFVELLTDPGELVLDPFAGSNTTGFVAERLGRRWLSIEVCRDFGQQSLVRFASLGR